MRTWQRSATAWTGTASPAWRTRSLNARSGAAAWRTGSAPSTAKARSGTAPPRRRPGAATEFREEPADLVPQLRAPRQAAPAGADDADEAVTLVDRHPVVLADAAHAVDQQRLDLGLQ